MHTHLVIIAWLAPVINALQTPPRKRVVVVGAGWAGLSTAWTLSKNNVDVTHIHVHPGLSLNTLSKTTAYKATANAPAPENTCKLDANVLDFL